MLAERLERLDEELGIERVGAVREGHEESKVVAAGLVRRGEIELVFREQAHEFLGHDVIAGEVLHQDRATVGVSDINVRPGRKKNAHFGNIGNSVMEGRNTIIITSNSRNVDVCTVADKELHAISGTSKDSA